ncbi:uncharacterized protein LOC142814489 isoform X4 [Rhipicephalus microplus]|uniref:uncharacterized protein LOC142814489 isoform X4 n=1 Tax=Rhipicephalus microplus TaxID=6941 RepID=UPI003F6A80DC
MAGNQNLYNQDPQYNQAYAATDPGNYYDNSAFQEGTDGTTTTEEGDGNDTASTRLERMVPTVMRNTQHL